MAPYKVTRKERATADGFAAILDRDRQKYKAMQANLKTYKATCDLVKHHQVQELMSKTKVGREDCTARDVEGSMSPLTEISDLPDRSTPATDRATTFPVSEESTVVTYEGAIEDTGVTVKKEEIEEDVKPQGSDDEKKAGIPQETLRQLRAKSIGMMRLAIKDWEERMAKAKKNLESQPRSATDVEMDRVRRKALYGDKATDCPMEGCNFVCSNGNHMLRRHLITHFPWAFFCPVCFRSSSREDALVRHFMSGGAQCMKFVRKYRFHIGIGTNGRLKLGLNRRYFNIYYLGAMQDFDMPDDFFEIIAGRKRDARIY